MAQWFSRKCLSDQWFWLAIDFFFQRDCPDGKLSKYKFIDIYKQFYKKGQVAKFCEHAFRVFDKDGSGYIGMWPSNGLSDKHLIGSQ